MNLRCKRCGHRFNPDSEGRAGVYLEPPGPNRLARQLVVQLCGGCADTLRAFIGLPPRNPAS